MDDLKDRLERAAELTKSLPDSLQAEAFRLAFEELSGTTRVTQGAKDQSRPSASRRRRKAAAADGGSSGARPRRRTGPKSAVEALIDAGYFGTPRVIEEIRQELDHASGLRYAPKAIATTVLRLLRERRLSREPGADDVYRYRAHEGSTPG